MSKLDEKIKIDFPLPDDIVYSWDLKNRFYYATREIERLEMNLKNSVPMEDVLKIKEIAIELRKYTRHNLTCDVANMKAECTCGFSKIVEIYNELIKDFNSKYPKASD